MLNSITFELYCLKCDGKLLVTDSKTGIAKCFECGLAIRIGSKSENDCIETSKEESTTEILTTKQDSWIDFGMSRIKKYVSRLSSMPKVLDVAEAQFEELHESLKKISGYNIEHLALVVVYIAVNLCNLPYSLKRLCKNSELDYDKVSSLYLKIQKHCYLIKRNSFSQD